MNQSWNNLLKLNSFSGRRNSIWFLSSLFLVPFVASKVPVQETASSFIFREHRRHLTSTTPLGMSAKLDHPSSQRNKGPIWEVLFSRVISSLGAASTDNKKPIRILEVAAGHGVHTDHFATQFLVTTKNFVWYPSDPSEGALASIQCYIDDNPLLADIVKPPISLTLSENGILEEATSSSLSLEGPLDVITCINMIHISPWDATLGLMKVAGKNLSDKGCLYCYGPYKVGGTAVESNL